MYKKVDNQPKFENFLLPFDGKLNTDNRWVQLSKLIPWDLLEEMYSRKMSDRMGRPGKSVRMAFGAQIIKHRLNLTDEETVEQIRENPYLQYFIGLEEFRDEAPFDSSLMVTFRERFEMDDVLSINDLIEGRVETVLRHQSSSSDSDDKDETPHSHSGKLVLDATVAPADMKYPTDLNLLNQAREKTEKLVDKLWTPSSGERKPRTYRNKARKSFLSVAKKRKANRHDFRKAIKFQLQSVERNLGHIENLQSVSKMVLSPADYEEVHMIETLFKQQKYMFQNNTHSVEDRIVSLSQPHIRPIVRGKANANVEFGAKLSMSLTDGIIRLDRLSWDAFNESEDLITQVEKYKDRTGVYPASVHADKIYGTRANRAYLKSKDIRFSGASLGRPSKETPQNALLLKEKRKQARQDELDRIPIEGKFGQGKRKYGMDRIMAKLQGTSETWIAMIILVMNLEKWLERVASSIFAPIFSTLISAIIKEINLWKSGFMKKLLKI